MFRHIRPRSERVHGSRRAWSPRALPRIPRFRWKARLACRRRCVFVRNPGDAIVMRRPFCRSLRRGGRAVMKAKAA